MAARRAGATIMAAITADTRAICCTGAAVSFRKLSRIPALRAHQGYQRTRETRKKFPSLVPGFTGSPGFPRSGLWLALLLILSGAAAHGTTYDPLVVELHGFLTSDGHISEATPAPGAVAFAASTPAAPAPALRFALAAPVRFEPGAPFEVTLSFRADKPVLPRDAEGHAFEVNVEPGGTATRIDLAEPILTPGSVASASATVQAPGALFAEGANVTLTIRPLMPLADGSLAVIIGGDSPSRFDAPDMRVPVPADLRMQDLPHTEFLLETESFAPPATHAVNVFSIGHDAITPPAAGAWSANGTYVVLRGDEPAASANQHEHADRARRIEAAHEFRVNGLTARVHPGLGVVVRVLTQPIRVECVRNCPAGYTWTYAAPASSSSAVDPPSALIPPPRDTRGVPVSEDEPAEKATPILPMVALAAIALAAMSKR